MTRKEVCTAVGITVKTLRLYEEKGLIAPLKTRRNGREYREYDQGLVEQLKKIVLLRRALFTMEEIKTMLDTPDATPEIFKTYLDWLEQQTVQFQNLKRAADQVCVDSLSGIDPLVRSLSATAAGMPLPQMDVKPNFRRIDAMEEPPRHTEPQVNFDETVPSARVMRQMNLALDKDKGNNINIAFGQYNELRRKETWAPGGPVQREAVTPKWYRILSALVSILLVISFLLFLQDPYLSPARIGFFSLLLFWIILAGIPPVVEHFRWLKQTPSSDPAQWRKEQKTRFCKILICVFGAALLIAAVILLVLRQERLEHPPADYQILFSVPASLSHQDQLNMEQALSQLVGDLNGDGNAHTDIDLAIHRNGLGLIDTKTGPQPLETYIGQSDYTLILITDLRPFGADHVFPYQTVCAPLPEDLATDYTPCQVDLTDCPLLISADLEHLTVYGCISQNATQEEYEFAAELLRKIRVK